jgi:O-antigen/teichoic acid export membrane protein
MTQRKALIGTMAMVGANALRLIAQLLVLPVVARLLGPQVYGVVALASPFVFFLLILSDLGLGPALIRAKDLTRQLESTVFWTAVAAGLVLAVFLAAIAYPLGAILGRPEISPILLGFCPLFLLVTAAIAPSAKLQRSGRFKTVAAIDIASAFAGMAAAVGGSLAGWGAWALVAQQLAFWLCRLALMLAATGFYPALTFRSALVSSSLGFSAGVVGCSVMGFVSGNLDNILIGTFLGAAPLGLYAVAFQIVNIPSLILGAVHYSLFPAISEAHRSGGSPANAYLGAARAVFLIAAPAVVGLALTADLLVALVLGDAWTPVGGLIRLLAPYGILLILCVLNAALLFGIGESGLEFRFGILRAACIAGGILAGIGGGAEGVAAGVSVGFAIACFFYVKAVMRVGGISAKDLWRMSRAPAVSCFSLALGVTTLRMFALDQMTLLSTLLISIVSGFLIYVSVLFIGFRSSVLELISMMKSMTGKC